MLANYAKLFGQYINFHKSTILFFNTPQNIQRNIYVVLEC